MGAEQVGESRELDCGIVEIDKAVVWCPCVVKKLPKSDLDLKE